MDVRKVHWPHLAVGATLMAALAGCAANQTQTASSAPTPAGTAMSAPQGGQPQNAAYGAPLTPQNYADLVVGNTLFRPLQSGGTTTIYVAPDQSMKLKIQTADGRVLQDSGRETLAPEQVCWQWSRAGTDCFHYYWSGRLLTFVSTGDAVLPAQFLVQKGNAAGL